MTPEAIDALERLKLCIHGKSNAHQWTGKNLRVATVEVNPRDIIDLCRCLPDCIRTHSLLSGSENAVDILPNIRSVGLHVVDVLHLIREADALTTPVAEISATTPAEEPHGEHA